MKKGEKILRLKILLLSLCFINFSVFAENAELPEKIKDISGIRADSDAPAWNIDVENDMRYCYRTVADLVFWRSSEDQTTMLTIEAQQTDVTKKYRWLADSGQTVDWFKSLPIVEQETYFIMMGEIIEHQLVLHQTSGDLQHMEKLGCTRQVKLLKK